MKLEKLTLQNFGIYAGKQEISFNNDKPVTLIGGMNGRGKTTILGAILLCLYGKRSFAFEENNTSFSQYLTQLTNKTNDNSKVKIDLTMSLAVLNGVDIYSVQRSWDITKKTLAFNTKVYKNGQYDSLLSEHWDFFIERTLPSAIAPFFFFDGEKVAEIANSDNEEMLKSSIKTLLGVDIIEKAIGDIKKITTAKRQSAKLSSYSKELTSCEQNVEKTESDVKESIKTLGILRIKENSLRNDLAKAQNRYNVLGGSLLEKREKKVAERAKIDGKITAINDKLIEMASGNLPLLLVKPLFKDIYTTAKHEQAQKSLQTAIEQYPILYKEFCEKKKGSINSFDKFYKFMRKKLKNKPLTYIISKENLSNAEDLYFRLSETEIPTLKNLMEEKATLLKRLSKLDDFLAQEVDKKATEAEYKKIISLTTEIAVVEEKIRTAEEKKIVLQTTNETAKHVLANMAEKAVANLEEIDDTKRVLIYSQYLETVLKEYKKELQSEKIIILGETITKCFKSLSSKRNFINKIVIDAETLEFIYYDDRESEIDPASLSAGEKQLLVIATLWALGICSKKDFPVIIDTPLARLDSVHRHTLIKKYFPFAGRQTILLSTDSEVTRNDYNLLKPYIGSEYTLIYDEDTRSSNVRRGYFDGDLQ
jgi:DNA sulfur modification protein DndD